MGASAERDGADSEERLPDFFIVGHQKCGTTALWQMLDAHPEVFMSAVKEPRFFAPDLWSRFAAEAPVPSPLHTREGYLALFADARPEQRAGEASPEYLRSEEAAGRIAEMRPDAKIIAIFREPAEFLRSFHLQMVSSNVEDERDFARAIALEEERRVGRRVPRRSHHPQSLLYSDHIRYVEQLRRYHDAFPAENVLVLVYEDFRADNEGVVRQVLRFLGVEETVAIAPVETKRLKSIRSAPMHRLANAARTARLNPSAAGPVGRAVNALTPAVMRSERVRAGWRRAAYEEPAPPDPALMKELRRRFKPEVEAASHYLGRDLVGLWGYGEID